MPWSPPNQEAILEAVNVAQLKVTPAQLAHRKFPTESLSSVLDKDRRTYRITQAYE